MNYRSALIVEHSPGHQMCLKAGIQQIGFQCSIVAPGEVVAFLQAQTRAGTEPSVVVIGPDVEKVVPLARRIRKVWPYGEVLFVPDDGDMEKLRTELRYAPMIGSNWSVSGLDNPRLPQMIEKAADTSRQRVRLRTTINHANLSLQTPPRVEHDDYRRLAVSEHYLASVLEQSQDAIISLDLRGAVLFWSAGAARLLNFRQNEVAGKPVATMAFWSEPLAAALGEILRGTRVLTVETQAALAKDPVDLEILFSGVHDHAGRLIGASLTLRDISARKQLLEVEREARRRAEEASKMKDEFLAILSHELRTPLSTIIGRTQLLQLKFPEQKELQTSLSAIERNAHLQTKLIEDLLDISAITAGKLRLRIGTVNLAALLLEAVDTMRPAALAKNLQIEQIGINAAPNLQGDSLRLKQVFLNILNNAIKFTPQGGCITVSVRTQPRYTEISITDSGIGIKPSFLPNVFNRFDQADSSASRSFGGLGLGLSIAEQLVALHSGNIRAESEGEGQGATFTVRLPRGHAEVPTQSSDEPVRDGFRPSSSLDSLRVLVVEDVPDARALMVEVLQSHSAIVCEAESGSHALQLLDLFAPDILISDIGMPEMDGYELLRRIRELGYDQERLPALAVSAFAGESDRTRALEAGFQQHVAKPLIVGELVDAVIDLCGERPENQTIS